MNVQRMMVYAIFVGTMTAAQAQSPVQEYRLENGLRLIVKEDHRAPVVVSQIWYKVGSSYEHGGITGVSHALEHMMFKGTKAHPAGEFSRLIAAQGGRENAFTGRDYTAYFQQLENTRLPISFALEADRMRGLLLEEEEFKKEIQVVIEERRLRTEDDPKALTYEQFNAAAFQSSSYRTPVIGWMNDLVNMRIADLREWYQAWYAPNNATLVVVGDVRAADVNALAKKYFGDIKLDKRPVLKPREETPQRGLRRLTVKAPAELPYVLMGYKVPVLASAPKSYEPYALEVLAGILDGGESARLARGLVRGQEIAASAGAGYDLYDRLDTLFMLDGTPTQGHTAEELERALRAEVQRLHNELVTPEELERVKTQVVAEDVYQRDSMFYQAMKIGTLETIGLDWSLLDDYVQRVREVTAAQVQAVARRYLIDETLTVAWLDPLPLDPSKPRPAAGGEATHVR